MTDKTRRDTLKYGTASALAFLGAPSVASAQSQHSGKEEPKDRIPDIVLINNSNKKGRFEVVVTNRDKGESIFKDSIALEAMNSSAIENLPERAKKAVAEVTKLSTPTPGEHNVEIKYQGSTVNSMLFVDGDGAENSTTLVGEVDNQNGLRADVVFTCE